VLAEVTRIVGQIRAVWSEVRIIIRGDSGFCRDEIMRYCEAHQLDYVFGLAKNSRLKKALQAEMAEAQQLHQATQQPARVFKDFVYRTRHRWSCERRVVGKAEYLAKGGNPRFIVTSMKTEQIDARALYEDFYCARGEMENRIKEQQLALLADRTSTSWMRPTNCGFISLRSPISWCTRCVAWDYEEPSWPKLNAIRFGLSCLRSAPRSESVCARCGSRLARAILISISFSRCFYGSNKSLYVVSRNAVGSRFERA